MSHYNWLDFGMICRVPLVAMAELIAPWSAGTTRPHFQENDLRLSVTYVKLKEEGENVVLQNL